MFYYVVLSLEEAQEKIIQTFTLKNADAEEVAKQLQDLNQSQDSQSRYPYYVFNPYSNQGGTPAAGRGSARFPGNKRPAR